MSGAAISGLVFAAFVVGLAALVVVLGRSAAKLQKELPERMARARPGRATITSIAKGGAQNRGSSVLSMNIALRVQPEGGEAYDATAWWEVRDIDIPQIQPGTVLDVLVDAGEPLAIYSRRFEPSVGPLAALFDERRKGAA